jgi:hypothetical protein
MTPRQISVLDARFIRTSIAVVHAGSWILEYFPGYRSNLSAGSGSASLCRLGLCGPSRGLDASHSLN